MKEVGMIFNAEMVSAILAGDKTQTRRPVNVNVGWEKNPHLKGYRPEIFTNSARNLKWQWRKGPCFASNPHNLPVNIGDLIYVREAWAMSGWNELISGEPHIPWYGNPKAFAVVYRASSQETHPEHPEWGKAIWKPSIHMPKEAARIWLEVTGVRVERVQCLTELDARAEGFPIKNNPSARNDFAATWRGIYGFESWDANSFVWVIEFKVLSTTGKPEAKRNVEK